MRQKRVKGYRKVMQMYCSTFKFREPYQLLVDAEFCRAFVIQKLDFQARLEDVLQGAVKPMITQCCMQALYDLGPEGQAAVDLAKEFERRKCSHFKVRPQDECMTIMAGDDNKNRYVIATQSLPLRQVLRKVAGLPIIYLARSVVLLESPSDQTLAKKTAMENQKLHAPAEELAMLNKTAAPTTNSTALIDSLHAPLASTSAASPTDEAPATEEDKKKKKKKGPKGPNPLSVRKKKDEPVAKKDGGWGQREAGKKDEGPKKEVVKKRGREEGEREERKKPRIDDEGGRVESLSKRGEREEGNGKRKRSRKTKGDVSGKEDVKAAVDAAVQAAMEA